MIGNETRLNRNLFVVAMILSALFMTGCEQRSHSKMMLLIRSAKNDVELIGDFEELYPETYSFVSYYTGEYGHPTWNSEAAIHKRYVLTMQMKITISRDGEHVLTHQEPHFFLEEISRLKRSEDGTWQSKGRGVADFGFEKWKTLVEHSGDFESIGIHLQSDAPLPLFKFYWRDHSPF
jgi:hypothetical protein